MGLRNVIVKDREMKDEDLKKIRENSLGLSLRDVQALTDVTPDLETYSARKRVKTFQIFSFKGKKGIDHKITLKNKRLARMVKQCRDLPGKELFQYFDAEGNRINLVEPPKGFVNH